MKSVIALGNPGAKYKFSRHNAGFIILDKFMNEISKDFTSKKFGGEYERIVFFSEEDDYEEKIILGKPLDYMNNSGSFVFNILNFFKIKASNLLVIYDDLSIPLGEFKLSFNKSSGGHNGVKDIIEKIGTKSFMKLRIGIGTDRFKNITLKDFVLKDFSKKENEILLRNKSIYESLIKDFFVNDNMYLMNRYNAKK